MERKVTCNFCNSNNTRFYSKEEIPHLYMKIEFRITKFKFFCLDCNKVSETIYEKDVENYKTNEDKYKNPLPKSITEYI